MKDTGGRPICGWQRGTGVLRVGRNRRDGRVARERYAARLTERVPYGHCRVAVRVGLGQHVI